MTKMLRLETNFHPFHSSHLPGFEGLRTLSKREYGNVTKILLYTSMEGTSFYNLLDEIEGEC